MGEARFAAGDRVITRVNDRSAEIYNRERWEVAAVDAEKRSVVLEGIDQARRVEVGADYLELTTRGGEAPALQHAYAVTTYCAQGTTVDRAYVMADPSMDKQEFYVATSRSREETYLYATPEIQAERSEYAPKPLERDAIGHIAEAAGRDRAQTAAHDEALRAELRRLPTQEIEVRHNGLDHAARQEESVERRYERAQENVERTSAGHEEAIARLEAAKRLGRKERKRELPNAQAREGSRRAGYELALREQHKVEPPTYDARREQAIARQVLAEREERVMTAMRTSPPPYIAKELGERPTDPTKARAWDRGVEGIERYRQENGVTDRQSALGREPQSALQRAAREAAQRRLLEAQRRLGREQQLAKSRERVRSIERGGFGISM